MQPEPTPITQKSSTSDPQDNPQSLHHGRQQQDHHAPGNLSSEESEGRDQRSTHRPAATAIPSPGRGSPRSDRSTSRLSSVSPPHSRSPGERIAEHEKATSYISRKKHGGPSFTVVQKSKNAGPSQGSVMDFPNGNINNQNPSCP